MQSAEEFYISISATSGNSFIKSKERPGECVALIRARDREIVDKCRKALIGCDEVGVDKYPFALDSVLRDLG